MAHDFDAEILRRTTDSIKWTRYAADVLPLWVADMDFASPEPVLAAMRARVEHGVFGYGSAPDELIAVIVERLASRYGWVVSPRDVLLLPGVVPALHMACRAFAEPGEIVLVQTPVYPPIRSLPVQCRRVCREAPINRSSDGVSYVDWDGFDKAVREDVRLFVLCNPQNPTGRVFSREELQRFAVACNRHDVVVVSDEIHCDILLGGHEHIPIAALDREIAARTVTLLSPSKTFNLSGLECAFAVVQDPDLRRRFRASWQGLVPHVNVIGVVAATAAYRSGESWLAGLRHYLQGNCDAVCRAVRDRMPGVRLAAPQGTYLAWLDCRESVARENPYRFFLEHARVALSDGETFGGEGTGFVRLNFGCTRATLDEALDRMAAALAAGSR